MIASVLAVLLLVSIGGLFVVFGMYATVRTQLSRRTTERDQLKEAVTVARGYLYSMSTNNIPGVSDGATRTLDAVDQYLQERT